MKLTELQTDSIAPAYQAEMSLLGALLMDVEALDKIEPPLVAGDFSQTRHGLIYQAIQRIVGRGHKLDPIVVAESLEKSGQLVAVGGLQYLGDLAMNSVSAANVQSHAAIIRNAARRNNLRTLGAWIVAESQNPAIAVDDIEAEIDSRRSAINDRNSGDVVSIEDAAAEMVHDIDARACNKCKSGLLTGLEDFDELTGGLEPGLLARV